MSSNWKRVNPGEYQSRIQPTIWVKTHCLCGRNCMFAWAIYKDDEFGGCESTEQTSYTRALITVEADKLINEMESE